MIKTQTLRLNQGLGATARGRTVRCQAQLGDKILPLIRTPFDLLALGPRIALGSVNSINETLSQLPADVEKLTAFVADPRPLAEKQAEFMEEIESRVVTYIEKGTAIEGDIIAAIPEPIKDALPQPVKDVILAPRPSSNTDNDDAIFAYPPTTASSNSTSNNNNGNLSTWTISSIDEGDARFPSTAVGGGNSDDAEFNGPPEIPGAAFMNNQVAAELVEIQTAVVSVKDALEALKSNTEPAKEGMLRLNLREAAQGLSGRLQQTRPGSRTSDSAVDAAIVEAEGLLGEVNALV